MTAPLTPEQVADVLDDAADYIEAHGWCQRTLFANRRACAAGAILCVSDNSAAGRDWETLPASRAFAAAVGVECDLNLIGAWNDTEGRTKQEVLDAFRTAAKQQRGRSPA